MNPLVEFLAGGGGLGYRQRKQKEDQEAEMARLFKEQQMRNAQLQQQAYELQLQEAQMGPQAAPMSEFQKAQVERWKAQDSASKTPKLNPAQERLAPFLPPTIDPFQASEKDWMEARERMKAGNAQKPMTAYQEAQVNRWKMEDEAAAQEKEAEAAEVEAFQSETLALVDSMLGHDGLSIAVGTIDGRTPDLNPAAADFANKHNTLVSRLTKDNLGIMKGVLSDKDIQILTNIGAGELNRVGSEEAYRAALNKLKTKLGGGAVSDLPEGVTEADIQATMAANNMTREQVLEALGVR